MQLRDAAATLGVHYQTAYGYSASLDGLVQDMGMTR
jgi:hypothetical protein